MNSTKSMSGDTYSEYRGVKISDLLDFVGLDDKAESVDMISVDGYMKTFSLEEIRKNYPQAAPALGLGAEDLGSKCGWVHYDAKGLDPEKPLPPANILLAFEADGNPLSASVLEPRSGKLQGDGPYRVIPPQQVMPGAPDLPETADPSCNDSVDKKFHFGADTDHNAGNGVRGVVAIRVNPLPRGTRDFNWEQGGWELLARKEIIIYGAVKNQSTK